MKFLNVSIENFCSIGEAAFSLSDQGLVVVTGKNKDAESSSSNGSGKSTLVVDSICWALFGKTTKGGTADSVTPGGKGKGTCVAVEFQVGDSTYKVSRHRKHKTNASKTVLTRDGVDISKATADDTEKLLAEILGITFDTFLYTTILGQGLMFRFSQLTDQNRKEILEGIAGAAIYETARTVAREDARNKASQVMASKAAIEQLENSVRQQTNTAQNLANQQAQADQDYLIRQGQADREWLDKQHLADLEFNDKQAQFDSQINQLTSQLVILESVPPPAGPDAQLISTFRETEQKAKETVYILGSKIQVAQSQLDAAEAHLRKMGGLGAECDRCGSSLTQEHMAAEIAERTAAIDAAKANKSTLLDQHAVAGRTHKGISDQLSQLQQQEQMAARAFQTNQNEISRLKMQLSSLETSKKNLVKQTYTKNVFTRNDYTQAIQQVWAQLEQAKNQIIGKITDSAFLTSQQEAADFWTTGFQEIRVAAIDNLLSFLNSRLAHYCEILCGTDIKVSLAHTDKGKIDLQVTTQGGTYLSASGGEKDRIDIAVAFALHDLACQCTNWHSNLLVLDEIAVFVDDAGIDRIMKLVNEKLDRVDSCFLISHNPVFAGYGDHTWTAVKEGGVTKLETS